MPLPGSVHSQHTIEFAAMLPRPRFILFDWGGTLVRVERQADTYGPSAEAAVEALRDSGCAVSPRAADHLRDAFATAITRNDAVENQREFAAEAFLRDWAAAHGISLLEDLAPVESALWRPWIGCLDPLGDVRGTLTRLAERGLRLGLVSNCATAPPACRAELARQGLADLMGMTLFSSELGVRKPHADMYTTALARARAVCAGNGNGRLDAGDILFVGDTPVADVTGPAQFGMRTALVRTGRWRGSTDELTHPPDMIIDSVHALCDMWT
jgi:FMN phosphatase YigB (HAD superfamily)